MRTSTLLVTALLAMAAHAEDATPVHPRPVLHDGERLFYKATAWKGFISSNVGTATLSVHHTAEGPAAGWRLVARAQGSSMGYSLDARVVSVLDATTAAPVEYSESQGGDRPRGRKLLFGDDALVYQKIKHCPGCPDPTHFVDDHHCTDHRCGNAAHDVWRVRHRHASDAAVCDPLLALYRARALGLRPGGPARVLRICAGHGIFDVTVQATTTERVTVAAGTFDAVRIELTPRPAPGTPSSARFQGLFGLSGTITLLADLRTMIPLKITGVVPMGVDVNCEVELTQIQSGR